MADDFRVMAATAGGVTETDLENIGWSPTQISAHGRAAIRLASA